MVRDESGATAVEYGLILGAIAGAIVAVLAIFGKKVDNNYSNVATRF